MLLLLGACRGRPAPPLLPVPADLRPGFSWPVRPLLDVASFAPDERTAIAIVAAAVRQAGGNPAEQFVVGSVPRPGTSRIEVVHARDLGSECRGVAGNCSGWAATYELNPEMTQIVKVWGVQ